MTIAPDRLRDVMGRFPTGVAIVACDGADGPSGLTTSALASVSLDPPLLLACLDNGSRTLDAVRDAGRFSVSVLREGQEQLALRFASKARMDEKFAGVDVGRRDGVPVLAEALAWIVCDLRELLPGGDHAIALGAITALSADAADGRPLLHHRGAFAGLHYGR
jgi:3-hydroxy-9,10-secoandrosta-1,3,5(10)-triene-9,17-dione monooxygenase reductase component